jgi:hypothetical protein
MSFDRRELIHLLTFAAGSGIAGLDGTLAQAAEAVTAPESSTTMEEVSVLGDYSFEPRIRLPSVAGTKNASALLSPLPAMRTIPAGPRLVSPSSALFRKRPVISETPSGCGWSTSGCAIWTKWLHN